MARKERQSLLAIFLSRLRKPAVEPPGIAPRPFQAISIYRGLESCAVAKRFSEHRFLAKDAPQLPLSGCTMTKICKCRYLKHKDRRVDRRRLSDIGAIPQRFIGKERRNRSGRRTAD